MNPDYENRLAREIDRQLKGLPDLQAPPTLVTRVMRSLETQTQAAWYTRPWQTWPVALKAVSLLFFLTLFGGLCFGSWLAPRTSAFSNVLSEITTLTGAVTLLRDTVGLLGNAVLLMIRQLSTGVLIGCAAAAVFAYFICVGLGTFCVRLALARR